MAERVITVELNVDASGAVTGLAETEDEIQTINDKLIEVEDSLSNLNKEIAKGEAAKSFAKLNDIVEKNVLSLADLGVAADNYKNIALAAGVTSPIGQEALKKAASMEKRMDKLNQEVTQLAEGGRNLNAAMQIGTGVIAGYTAFQGVTELLGEENEALQETFVKLQAAQSALMGIKELSIVLDKEGTVITTAQAAATKVQTAVTLAYNTVVGTSTGLMKAFKLAMASTGIGLLIVGLGLLIANFDSVVTWVKDVISWFGSFGEVMVRVAEFFGLVEKGSADLMEQERLAAEARKKHEKDLADANKERLKQIDEVKNATIAAADETIKALELEIDTLDAEGKASDEATVKILEAELAKVVAVLDGNNQKIASWTKYYTDLALFRGQDEKEFKASMLAQGLDLEEFQDRANAVLEENDRTIQFAENKITKFKREQGEKRAAEAKSIQDQMLEEQKKVNEAWLALEEELTQLLLANMEEGAEKELAILMDKQGRERDAIIAAHGENAELLEQLDIKQEKELESLQEKFMLDKLAKEQQFQEDLLDLRQASSDLEKQREEEENQARIDKANATLDQIQEILDTASEINEILNEIGERRTEKIEKQADDQLSIIEKQKKAELNREGLTANQKLAVEQQFAMQEFRIKLTAAQATDKINKRKFQREKAFKLAQIAIDTGVAVVGALASSPPPLNFVNAAIVGGIGIAQAAMVASTKFEGTAGNIQPPSFEAPSVDAGGGGAAADGGGAGVNDGVTTETEGLVNGQPTIVISQVEINKVQGELAQIDEVSTL